MKNFLVSFMLLVSFSPSSGAEEVPGSWVKNDTKFFSLMLPPEMEKIEVPAEDSYVGAYASSKYRVEYDYGLYSEDLSASPNADFKYIQLEIDHVPAKIFSYVRDGKYIAAVHFPNTGAGLYKQGDKLTVTLTCPDTSSSSDYMLIFKSIRFKKQI